MKETEYRITPGGFLSSASSFAFRCSTGKFRRSLPLRWALCADLLGAMFYILFIALIVYRWTFLSMEPAKLTPP